MRFIKVVLVLGVLFGTLPVVLTAQDEDKIKVETNLVSLGVVAKDRKGNHVSGLQKDQFEIIVNKEKQDIALFSSEDSPVSFGIVYDLHPTTNDRTKVVLNALKQFTGELRPQDDFFVIVFNEYGNLDLDFVPPIEQVEKHLSSGKVKGTDSLYDAVYLAAEKLKSKKNAKKSLIIISDAADHYSHHSLSELNHNLRSFNVQIYALILTRFRWWDYSDITLGRRIRRWPWDTRELDRAALKDIAEKSGGKSETPYVQSTRELYEIFRDAAADMRRQYILGFYPETIDNKWHKIEVKTSAKDLKGKKLSLIYRKGYQNTTVQSGQKTQE